MGQRLHLWKVVWPLGTCGGSALPLPARLPLGCQLSSGGPPPPVMGSSGAWLVYCVVPTAFREMGAGTPQAFSHVAMSEPDPATIPGAKRVLLALCGSDPLRGLPNP
ncbi:hypothetical protein WJX73_006234 [Symbiochloris irregularis]|uniref:Uncharacterized protein n=1 Tax=Symbiochloris irregularis TaxID=706552 RepID=A0AAW1NR44_9CHLO